jgi:hypothetical protein
LPLWWISCTAAGERSQPITKTLERFPDAARFNEWLMTWLSGRTVDK